MSDYIDQTGERIFLPNIPKRIVSLVPSLTELIIDLGLEQSLVGCTKFCVHPKKMKSHIQRIGGTKNPSIKKIKSLNPDLIIANKEENTKEDITELKLFSPTWVTDVNLLDDALQMIMDIGNITNTSKQAQLLMQTISNQFSDLKDKCSKLPSSSVCYCIWKNPLMVVGSNNFINSILEIINLNNLWSNSILRYPELANSDIHSNKPDYIFLSSEPYPFSAEHKERMEIEFPDAKLVLVDGEMFSWYGSRMLMMSKYLLDLRFSLN